jgi:hypothetical protein
MNGYFFLKQQHLNVKLHPYGWMHKVFVWLSFMISKMRCLKKNQLMIIFMIAFFYH